MNIKESIFENELVLALKNKEPGGMQLLYNSYHRVLLNIISQIVKDDEPADILQTVLIKVWDAAGLYNSGKGRFSAWIFQITRNCALDVLRSKAYKNRRRLQYSENCLELIEKRGSTFFNTDIIGLRNIVNQLDPKFSKVIELVYFKGFTHIQAAKELNMKLGTVKTRIKYGIEEIRKEFC